MEEYLQNLSVCVAEHPPDIHSDGGDTILDALFWAYCESAGADNENVQLGYDTLQQQLQLLPAQDMNTIINIVNDFCWEHDQPGFISGFKMDIAPGAGTLPITQTARCFAISGIVACCFNTYPCEISYIMV